MTRPISEIIGDSVLEPLPSPGRQDRTLDKPPRPRSPRVTTNFRETKILDMIQPFCKPVHDLLPGGLVPRDLGPVIATRRSLNTKSENELINTIETNAYKEEDNHRKRRVEDSKTNLSASRKKIKTHSDREPIDRRNINAPVMSKKPHRYDRITVQEPKITKRREKVVLQEPTINNDITKFTTGVPALVVKQPKIGIEQPNFPVKQTKFQLEQPKTSINPGKHLLKETRTRSEQFKVVIKEPKIAKAHPKQPKSRHPLFTSVPPPVDTRIKKQPKPDPVNMTNNNNTSKKRKDSPSRPESSEKKRRHSTKQSSKTFKFQSKPAPRPKAEDEPTSPKRPRTVHVESSDHKPDNVRGSQQDYKRERTVVDRSKQRARSDPDVEREGSRRSNARDREHKRGDTNADEKNMSQNASSNGSIKWGVSPNAPGCWQSTPSPGQRTTQKVEQTSEKNLKVGTTAVSRSPMEGCQRWTLGGEKLDSDSLKARQRRLHTAFLQAKRKCVEHFGKKEYDAFEEETRKAFALGFDFALARETEFRLHEDEFRKLSRKEKQDSKNEILTHYRYLTRQFAAPKIKDLEKLKRPKTVGFLKRGIQKVYLRLFALQRLWEREQVVMTKEAECSIEKVLKKRGAGDSTGELTTETLRRLKQITSDYANMLSILEYCVRDLGDGIEEAGAECRIQ